MISGRRYVRGMLYAIRDTEHTRGSGAIAKVARGMAFRPITHLAQGVVDVSVNKNFINIVMQRKFGGLDESPK